MALGEIDVLGQTPAAFMDDTEKRRDIDKTGYPPSKTAAASTYGKADTAMQASVYEDRAAYVKDAYDRWDEYVYLFDDGAWFVCKPRTRDYGWLPIDEAISSNENA